MAIFPVSRGKNHISQGVEDWGSLISVPLALRELNANASPGPEGGFYQRRRNDHIIKICILAGEGARMRTHCPKICKPERLGEGSKIGKCPKVVRRGCKRSFGPTSQRSPKSHLHRVQPCFAPVQPQVAPVQEGFRSLGSKDLLHPLLTTFGHFPIFDPSPRRSGLQPKMFFLGKLILRQ